MLRSKHRRRSSAASRALHREQRSNDVENSTNQDQTDGEDLPPSASIAENSQEGGQTPNTSQVQSTPSTDVDELSSKMSSLKFVPPSVRFGRGGRRAGLSRS